MCRKGPVRLRDVAGATGPLLLAGHIAVGVVLFARPWLPGQPVLALLSGVVLAYVATGIVISAFPAGRAVLREGWTLIAPRLRRPPRPLAADPSVTPPVAPPVTPPVTPPRD